MENEPEVKILSQSPDRGNLTPKRQGYVGREASSRELYADPHREGGLKEAIGAWWSKRKRSAVKRVRLASRSSATKPCFCRRRMRIGARVTTKFVSSYPARSAGFRTRGRPTERENPDQ